MRILFIWFLLLAACDSSKRAEDQSLASAAIAFDGAQAADAKSRIAHGGRLAAVLGCSGCHGRHLTGEDWSDPEFGRLWTANLTRAAADYDDAELARVIASGRRPDRDLWEMPSHLFTKLAAEDMAALIAFLRSKPPSGEVRPAPLFKEAARREITAGTFKSSAQTVAEQGSLSPPAMGSRHQLARYVVRATCAECHGMDLRGGQPHPAAAVRPDLRIVAAYDLEQFKHLLRTGKAKGGRELELMSGVARGRYKYLTDNEISAVHSYLLEVAEKTP